MGSGPNGGFLGGKQVSGTVPWGVALFSPPHFKGVLSSMWVVGNSTLLMERWTNRNKGGGGGRGGNRQGAGQRRPLWAGGTKGLSCPLLQGRRQESPPLPCLLPPLLFPPLPCCMGGRGGHCLCESPEERNTLVWLCQLGRSYCVCGPFA